MARYSQRPENALKRANEFIDVGKPARALDTLYEVFRNKKWAYSWSESVLEPIMFKYLDLCVELKKSLIAKEGLFQYRNMFQSVNVGSLENVIRGYLRMAEEKTEAAREQSQQAVIDIDDLDNLATPESILLSAVSGEDAQDRSDRTILTPWVKFLWESYCQCLELLRTNAHCETLYHDIARMAFHFCLKYNRKTEFRKLCDKLRKHLEDISKLPLQVANVSLNKPETQQFNLETRLVQLDSAIQMELWQEAYKATEDIHGLMHMSKKPPVPKTMANYYQKLAMVFWKAGYYLFHAAALFKLFQLSRDMKKNLSNEELQRMACRVLLATLCIPLPSAHPEFDRFIETDKSPLEKAQKLAVLLTLQQPPTRASLIRELVRLNVVNLASDQLKALYSCMEVEFNPLTLCKRVQAITSGLQGDEQYIPPLQDVTLVKLIKQVSQVYQTIKFSRLLELATFTTPFHLERMLVDCVRHNDMQIRIDHGAGCVHFGIDLSESQREDRQEGGPVLQSMPSEQIRTQLINMSHVLNSALRIINPNANKEEKDSIRIQLVKHYRENMVKEHQQILARHKIIEDRKEYLERLNTFREEEEARKAEEAARQQALAEQQRIDQELAERERKRQDNERQEIRNRLRQEKMLQISQTTHGQKVLKKLDEEELKKLDAEQIAARELEELQKEKREMQQKLKSQEKKIDYFERAKRLEEIPLLQQAFKDKQVEERKLWEEQEARRIEELVIEREKAVEHRKRLSRMFEDRQEFLNRLKAGRSNVYQAKLKEFEKRLTEERKKRLAQRREERKQERKAAWEKEKEEERVRKLEEEKRKKAEEERLKKEEEERLEAIRKAEKEEEERKRIEMLDRKAEQQRQREEEAARRHEEAEKALASSWRSKPSMERGRDSDRGRDMDRGRDADKWRKSDAPDSKGVWKPSRSFREAESRPSGVASTAGSGSWRRGGDAGEGRGGGDSADRAPKREEESGRSYRREDEGSRGGFSRKDDDRGFRKEDERGFRKDDDRGFRKDDERGFRKDDERSFRKDDERSFRKDDERSFRKDDDRGFRKDDDSGRAAFKRTEREFDRRPESGSTGGSWRNARGTETQEPQDSGTPRRGTEEKKDWRTRDAALSQQPPPKPRAEENSDDSSWKKVHRR